MLWGRRKNAVQQRLNDVEAARRSTVAEINKIQKWVGDAREGYVELAPVPRRVKRVLGVEKRRARFRFTIWMIVLVVALFGAWQFFLAR